MFNVFNLFSQLDPFRVPDINILTNSPIDSLAGPPIELITEDGIYLITEDGNYIGVLE